MKEVLKYSNCFVCGDKNKHGLKARFFSDGNRVTAEVVASRELEGYRGIYHGGIISALLDEVMIKAILAQEKYAVTAELTIRFVTPVKVGDTIRLSGRIVRSKGRVFHTEGSAIGDSGQTFATATARYVEAGPDLRELLMQSID